MIYELIDDFAAALAALPRAHPRRGPLETLAAALRRESRHLAHYPTELMGYLSNQSSGHDGAGSKREAEAGGAVQVGNIENIVSRWLAERQVRRPRLRNLTPMPVPFDSGTAVVLRGHPGMIAGISYSPDGRRLATAGSDGTICIWNVENGQQLSQLGGADAALTCIAFSPDCRRIAAGEDSRRDEATGKYVGSGVRIWDAETGVPLGKIRAQGVGVTSLAWFPDSRRLVSGRNSGVLRIDDAETLDEIYVLVPRDPSFPGGRMLLDPFVTRILSLSCSPDGRYVAVKRANSRVQLLDATAECALIETLEWVCRSNMAFSPDGARLALGIEKNCVAVVELAQPRSIRKFAEQAARIEAVAWSPDGQKIVSGGWDGAICVWNAETGALLHSPGSEQNSVTGLAWSPDGTRLASASRDAARVWEATGTGTQARAQRYDRDVVQIAFSPAGDLVAAAFADETLSIRRLHDGAEVRLKIAEKLLLKRLFAGPATDLEQFARARASGPVEDYVRRMRKALDYRDRDPCGPFCFTPDGRTIAISTKGATIGIWDVATGEQLDLWCGHDKQPTSIACSPGGTHLASCGWGSPVFVWDVATGRETARLVGPAAPVKYLTWSRRGALLAGLAENGVVRLWKADTLDLVRDLAPHEALRLDYRVEEVRRLEFSADDGVLVHWEPEWWGAGAKASFMNRWDVASGALRESTTPTREQAERFLAEFGGMTVYSRVTGLATEVRTTAGDELIAAFPVSLGRRQACSSRVFAGASRADLYVLELEPADLDF